MKSDLYAVEINLNEDQYEPYWVVLDELVEHSSLEVEQRPCVYSSLKKAKERSRFTDHRSRVVALRTDFVVYIHKRKRGIQICPG